MYTISQQHGSHKVQVLYRVPTLEAARDCLYVTAVNQYGRIPVLDSKNPRNYEEATRVPAWRMFRQVRDNVADYITATNTAEDGTLRTLIGVGRDSVTVEGWNQKGRHKVCRLWIEQGED